METIAITKIKTWGNTLGIRIPKKVTDTLNLLDGTQIKVSIDENKIILESTNNLFFDLSKDVELSALLSKITKKNKHSRDDPDAYNSKDSDVLGKEIW